jgi:hypothetical protein
MTEPQAFDAVWWVTAVELPVLGGLFWLISRARLDAEAAVEQVRRAAEAGLADIREALAAYKLEVAKTYVSVDYLKDVERRLTDHLLRIDARLEALGTIHGGGVR